ncbi:MAG: hypothetical protein R2697_14350 [Ilumatobacteraceae bacterium]
MLGRLTAEQHHEVDALVAHPHDGTVRDHADHGIPGRHRRRRHAPRTRRRRRRCLVRLPVRRCGELFALLVADRDGHEFVPSALERDATAYLTSRPPVGGTAIEVADTAAALMALAAGDGATSTCRSSA